MPSVYFDRSTGWWKIKYYAGPNEGRVSKPLCKHPGSWSKSRPPKRATADILRLADPYVEAERLAKLGREAPRVRKTPLAPYLKAYQDRIALSHAVNTREAVSNACRKFLVFCERRGVRHVQDVTYAACRDWIAARLTEGAKRSTVVTERSNLTPVWSQALSERIVSENPWLSAKVPGKPRKEVPTAWTPEEAAALIAELDAGDWLRDLVILGLNTGIRITALLSLRWEQVDWRAGLIRVRAADSKSSRPYEVPITPTALTILSARQTAAESDRGLIFPSRSPDRPFSSRTTFERIKRAVKRAGVPDYGDYNHVMRRTYATIAINSGVPLEVVSRCLDHASLNQTQRAYAHLLNERIIQGMAGFDISPEPPPPPPPAPPSP